MSFIVPLPPSGSYALAAASLAVVETDYFDSGSSKVTDIQFTPSNAQSGDLLLALIGNDGNHSLSSVPSGSTLIGSELSNGAVNFRQHRMTLTGSEGTLTWTLSSQNQAKAYFFVIRNADGTAPIADEDGISGYSSSTGVTLPALTVDRNGSLFIHGFVHDVDGSTPTISRPSATSAADMEVEDAGESYSVGMHVALEHPGTGSTGTRGWSISPSDSNQALGAIVQPAEGGLPPEPQETLEVDGIWSYVESGDTGNNSSSGGELTLTDNRVSSGPDATAPAGQRPAYSASRQNGKHGWVFGSGADHIKFGSNAVQDNFDVLGGYTAAVIKAVGLGSSAYPRIWAQSDTIYLHLQAGASGATHKLGFYRRYSDSDVNYVSTNDVITDGQAHIVEVMFDTTSPVAPPTVRVDGVMVQLDQVSAGTGTPISTAGKALYIGNRQENDGGTSSLDRGFSGDIYAFVSSDVIPPFTQQKTVLDELSASWGITVANPFVPSIEPQTFFVPEDAADGQLIGTATAQAPNGVSLTYALTGSATAYYEIDAGTGQLTVKAGVTLPSASAPSVSGTVQVTDGTDSDSAVMTFDVVEQSTSDALEWSRASYASWMSNPGTLHLTLPANGDKKYSPGSQVDDGVLSANSDLIVYGPPGQTRVADETEVNGIRRVAFVGIHLKSKNNDSSPNRLLGSFDIKDQIWLEGLMLEPGYDQDGWQGDGGHGSGAHEPDMFVQNVFFKGLDGNQPGRHSDCLQPLGWIGHMRIGHCWGEHGYQGLFLSHQYPGGDQKRLRQLTIRHTDLEHIRLGTGGHGTNYQWAMERYDDPDYTGGNVELTDCWGTIKNAYTPPKPIGLPESYWSYTQTSGGSVREGKMYLKKMDGSNSDQFINLAERRPVRPGGPILEDNGDGTFRRQGSAVQAGGKDYT